MASSPPQLVLPYAQDAEEHVIGAILISERALQTVAEILEPRHFYGESCRHIYTAALKLADQDTTVDIVTLTQQLATDGTLDKAGGSERVHLLASLVPATSNVHHHAEIVREHSVRRELITVGQDIARSGWEPDGDLGSMLGRAEELVYNLTTKHESGELQPIKETLAETYDTLDKPGGVITGTPTGITALDTLTAGFQPGNLIIVAARPGMGKSALALSAVHHNAVNNMMPAAFFTLEMSSQEINQRLLSIDTSVGLMKIRTRVGLTPEDRHKLAYARPVLEEAPLYIDDTVNARLVDIRARCRRLKSKMPDLNLIVIDYLQLMISDTRSENRNLEVSQISRGLKLLARELEIPVVAISQLNRALEFRHDKRPMLSDLRDSGSLEQDADLVLFVYRDDYYNPKTADEGVTELILGKHRNGPLGLARAAWLKGRACFSNLAEE